LSYSPPFFCLIGLRREDIGIFQALTLVRFLVKRYKMQQLIFLLPLVMLFAGKDTSTPANKPAGVKIFSPLDNSKGFISV